jgi:hypothetical protein
METPKLINFLIRNPIWTNKIWKSIYSMSHKKWCNKTGNINLELCYGVSEVIERYLEVSNVSFNLSR